MKIKLNIKGDKRLIKEIKKDLVKQDRAVRTTVEKYANKIRNEAIDRVPVDEGTLQGSIGILRDGEFVKEIGTNLEYAAYIEFGQPEGTGPNKGPRPYLRPAVEAVRKAFETELARKIKRAIE